MSYIDLLNYSNKYGNKQNLLFKIINKINDEYYDIQFEIDDLILEKISYNKIIYGNCHHPNFEKYPIKKRQLIYYHNCFIEAQKYSRKTDFQFGSKSLYKTAQTNKWLNDICEHMIIGKEKWTKEKLLFLSLQCVSRTDFKYKFSSAYHWALRNGYLDEVCEHMGIIGNINQNDFLRIVYIYLFPNKTIYIGISKDFIKRHKERKYYPNDSAQKYINEMNLIPEIKFLSDYIESKEAQKLERFYIEKYKKDGWNVLNKNSGGSIGGSYKHK